MFITKKHLSRRALLRGAGAAIALPLLDSMIPASTALAQTAANPMPRLGAIYIPHGATMAQWTPTTVGKDWAFTPILKSLEGYRKQMNIISGLANTPVGPEEGEDSGGAQNHERAAAAFLTCAHPVKGDRAFVGQSFDQLVAEHLGQDTPLPSVELAIEPSNNTCGDAAFTCSYRSSLSWKTPTLGLPMENNPQLVFERLFGDGSTDAERREKRRQSASMLDSIREDVASLNLKLPAADRARVSDYLEEVREIERRVALIDAKLSDATLVVPDAPLGIPNGFENHINLMFDLQVLAFKSDITRISTLMMAGEGSNTRFPASGVSEGFHNSSHHSNEQKNKDLFALINTYHINVLKGFFDRLAATPDGDGTLLDHSLIIYGSSMSDANEHNFDPIPMLLMGGANGLIEGGRHIKVADHTPLANMYLGLLDKFGIHRDSFGNSTGRIEV
ncbi:MAG: hypothetical protein RLZZ227_1489 [Pseudomonadota bacterium]|jgi:hypothetical protein